MYVILVKMEYNNFPLTSHLQRVHHTVGQDSHLASNRLYSLLELSNVSCR